MKLAELEAKAKALAGTQHWRGLDPEAVLEALAEVERLRAKLKEYNELSPIVQKLTQARAAILAMAQADTDTELVTLARQALKEIDE